MLMDDLARRFANRVCCDPRYFLQVELRVKREIPGYAGVAVAV